MDGLMTFIHTYKLVDGLIVLLGIVAIGIVAERAKVLFRDLSTPSDFYRQVVALMVKKDVAQASAICSTLKGKPLPDVLRRLIDNCHLSPDDIEKILNTSMSEVVPPMTRRLGYLSMIANVVTMVGLLGTVMGLIISFQAVSMADPAQKQTLLAQGISMAMHATALGLMVAIPVMIAYSMLVEKQTRIVSELDHLGQEMLEFIRSQDRQDWGVQQAFPTGSKLTLVSDNTAPPPPTYVRAA